ncbi:PREDICTED: RING-H2 finger protein ATL38-like [Camelina sativa]|uniref:RING-type E3 ubiquitin transferase n=1 Tax=Camelina sativa TaxID=90675 RepID=A0ABM0SL96_CAMSA|nr:PREDICTED: RING-H2 finger protein ATL38-like [Camelina sativa]
MVFLERKIRVLLQYVTDESSDYVMAQPGGTETKAIDLAIIVITLLLFAIFVVGLASVCFRWTSRQFHSAQSIINPFTDSSDDESRTSITATRGLDEAIINSFPTFLYSEVKERRIGIGGVECAVCLCEFEDDETLRLIPSCCHVFHADCVNAWLSDHSTCPLCRVDLFFQPGERSVLIPDPNSDSANAHLFDGVTWTNANRAYRSWSTRLSHCRVSQILFSRSHSTGHSVVQPVNNLDRFTLRLPEEVRAQLTKKRVDHVALVLPQERSSRQGYRSRSAGSERSVFSYQRNNNRPLRSVSFSFSDCAWSTSGGKDVVAPSKTLPDDRV